MHRSTSISALAAVLGLGLAACDDKKDTKAGDAGKADAKAGDAGKAPDDAKVKDEPEAKAEPEAKVPELSPLAIEAWKVEISAPAGTKVGELEEGDAELEMPDSVTLSTEGACGYDVELNRHWKKSFDKFYDDAKTAAPDGLSDVKYLVDEKTDAAFAVHYAGKAPLGDMYGANTGLVVEDRLILCGAGLGRMEPQEAACVLAVCKSLKPAG
jgi:hypothetical protein